MDNNKLVKSFLKTFVWMYIGLLLTLGICLLIYLATSNIIAFFFIIFGLLFITVWVLTYHYM